MNTAPAIEISGQALTGRARHPGGVLLFVLKLLDDWRITYLTAGNLPAGHCAQRVGVVTIKAQQQLKQLMATGRKLHNMLINKNMLWSALQGSNLRPTA